MLLYNQVRPYEALRGETEECRQRWILRLSEDLKQGTRLSIHRMKNNFYRMAADFAQISRTGKKKQRIGIVGELYIKYCHMGNWNLVQTLLEEGCESHTNGLSWYALYYMDTHLAQADTFTAMLYRVGMRFFEGLQKEMIRALQKYYFYTLPEFSVLKKEAEGYVSYRDTIGMAGTEAAPGTDREC